MIAVLVGVFDGLPHSAVHILLVHGVRARRGWVAREGEARSLRPMLEAWLGGCKFGCRGMYDMHPVVSRGLF